MTATQLQVPPLLLPEPAQPEDRLRHYAFPAGLAERLRREQGWSPAHTLAVLEEYRRFVLLATESGLSLTPSRAVDAAWHAHLTFTRDYWLRLTPLLPAPLHHEPSSGPADGDALHAQQYLETLRLYRARFGEPDASIWPDPRRAVRPKSARWLTLAALWGLGGAALLWSGVWGLAALLLVGVWLVCRRPARSGGTGDPNAAGDGGEMGWFDFGAGDASCGGDGDAGSSCGSGCGSGCGS
ncbi:hypothetical protein DKM44_05455 [Deinococcus irradiatisoli]|uniref:TIGR04222 domain-containing membrane protein n=1 Tax=Deinococcus irradiatisoli TaxID=2202254 RepID=A0A2Z3JC65_9DEIO|nr:hypothetical protein [Deinococcus irradiatisoli]AWN22743.1 hypothetical protein DKM44_05455 [Deinococcus irradiatisoli]